MKRDSICNSPAIKCQPLKQLHYQKIYPLISSLISPKRLENYQAFRVDSIFSKLCFQ